MTLLSTKMPILDKTNLSTMSPTCLLLYIPSTSVYQVLISICTAKAASQMEDGLETKDKWRPSCQQLRLTDISPYASSGQKFTFLKALLRLKLRSSHNVILLSFLVLSPVFLAYVCGHPSKHIWQTPQSASSCGFALPVLVHHTFVCRSSILHSNTGLCSKQPLQKLYAVFCISFNSKDVHKAYNGKAYIRYRGIREK